jgi:hypothetical protein
MYHFCSSPSILRFSVLLLQVSFALFCAQVDALSLPEWNIQQQEVSLAYRTRQKNCCYIEDEYWIIAGDNLAITTASFAMNHHADQMFIYAGYKQCLRLISGIEGSRQGVVLQVSIDNRETSGRMLWTQ